MNILVFSDNDKISDLFKSVSKIKEHDISFLKFGALKKELKNIAANSLVYVDISKLISSEINNTLKTLQKHDNIYYGILDSKNMVKDVASLFYNGAFEYIGREIFKQGINAKRFQKSIDFIKSKTEGDIAEKKEAVNKIDKSSYILSGNDWKNIKPGKNYTFCLMFIELDAQSKLKAKYGKSKLNEFIGAFHNDISENVSEINGKIWMWMDFGGLILIPFDGKKCGAILKSFELMLNRKIMSVENYSYNTILSFRIALHIGNTEYKERGDTGSIVSDSINSIFHLGQKYAKPGSLLLTENLFEYIPEGLEDCFVTDGVFEGRVIKRMKKFL